MKPLSLVFAICFALLGIHRLFGLNQPSSSFFYFTVSILSILTLKIDTKKNNN
ncbi:hypothetical protein [Oceanirhabdus sp. W0125-5]|uniref:hypothetical protein n=1 Tax=Oceanirhabdus sp. W0125-5 TaxID=2999116 RepID=UPI0022F2B318|nr:hypothetical protein [Oceanirhabdus sp. W0125-5]WBW97667.1 hypothetical protein OW730_02495 [Oceanirhabdus sp. W0125-5]